MKDDIVFYKATNVYIAAIKEWDEDFTELHWNVYLINNLDQPIHTVFVVSRGKSDSLKTSTLRHFFKDIAPKSSSKVEFIVPEVLNFTNEYLISFFIGNRIYERKFTFNPGTINENNIIDLPVMEEEGILAL